MIIYASFFIASSVIHPLQVTAHAINRLVFHEDRVVSTSAFASLQVYMLQSLSSNLIPV